MDIETILSGRRSKHPARRQNARRIGQSNAMVDHQGGNSARTETAQSVGVVQIIVGEMMAVVARQLHTEYRFTQPRSACRQRQIIMYICHVTLRCRMVEIGRCLGRDRTTVSHACAVIEDLRDYKAFDRFISSVERVVATAFGIGPDGAPHEGGFHQTRGEWS